MIFNKIVSYFVIYVMKKLGEFNVHNPQFYWGIAEKNIIQPLGLNSKMQLYKILFNPAGCSLCLFIYPQFHWGLCMFSPMDCLLYLQLMTHKIKFLDSRRESILITTGKTGGWESQKELEPWMGSITTIYTLNPFRVQEVYFH